MSGGKVAHEAMKKVFTKDFQERISAKKEGIPTKGHLVAIDAMSFRPTFWYLSDRSIGFTRRRTTTRRRNRELYAS
jgi:hypothetical protein